jgi:hypothetical protein
MYLVATGNPWDGITLYGPFSSEIEAMEWAENNGEEDSEYQLVRLQKPVKRFEG